MDGEKKNKKIPTKVGQFQKTILPLCAEAHCCAESALCHQSSQTKKRTNMEQVQKIPVYKNETIYQVCKDFVNLYPETGEKIFNTFRSQFSEAAFKFNSVESIVEVVYQINWGGTEEGFLWWDEFYTHLKKVLEEQLDGEKNN